MLVLCKHRAHTVSIKLLLNDASCTPVPSLIGVDWVEPMGARVARDMHISLQSLFMVNGCTSWTEANKYLCEFAPVCLPTSCCA